MFKTIAGLAIFLFGSSIGITVTLDAKAVSEMTLEDCYRTALTHNETIGAQDEILRQAEETYQQARGSLLPSIVSTASYLKQADPNGGTVSAGIYPTSQPLVKLSLTQPIFQGMAEYAALSQSGTLKDAQKESKKQAMLSLYLSIAQSYFPILSMESDVKNIEEEIRFYNERIRELKERVKIGRSQVSEVLTAQASVANLRAQIQQDRGQILVQRETLSFLTGIPQSTQLLDNENDPTLPLPPIESFLNAVPQRPDLRSLRLKHEASLDGIKVAKAGHFPTANLNANYYFVRPAGFAQSIHWDVTGAISLPLFSGGVVQSKIRSATSLAQQNELAYEQGRRQVDTQIRSYYQTLLADQAQVSALKDATRIAEKNYYEQIKEFRLGLVTNIDVLSALATFQEDNRAYDKARFVLKLDWVNLQLAALQKNLFF